MKGISMSPAQFVWAEARRIQRQEERVERRWKETEIQREQRAEASANLTNTPDAPPTSLYSGVQSTLSYFNTLFRSPTPEPENNRQLTTTVDQDWGDVAVQDLGGVVDKDLGDVDQDLRNIVDQDSGDVVDQDLGDVDQDLGDAVDQDVRNVIESSMPCIEVVEVLVKRGCADLTNLLDDSTSFPVANGGLGDVFSGQLRDGTPVAIKTIRTHYDPHRSARVYHKQAAKEIYTWSKCKHPNVVGLVGLAVFRDCLAMISRWQENGTLPQYLSKNPSANRCKLSTSICAGLVYLHDNDIVHGDLKGANVLVSKDGTAMLADFGNATMLYTSLQFTQSSTSITSTPRWTAPEILEGLTRHTEAGDVYSLGMTILETFTSKVPFPDKVDLALIFHVVLQKSIPTRPNKIIPPKSIDGDRLWSILTKCWTYNPKNRPIARGIWEGIKSITPDTLMVIGGKAEGKLKDNSKE